VISIDPDDDGAERYGQQHSALSIVAGSASSDYILHHIKVCGVNVVDQCARSVLADIDSWR
jgi:hypothetical protein